MRHLGLKSLSILIAILLSVYVNSESNITTARVPVSVDVRDLPADRIIVWQVRKQIEVEVRGPSFLVNRLVLSPPMLRLKVPESVESKFSAQINRNDLDIQLPLQVLSIEPSTISFAVEKKITKELRVKVPHLGELKNDLQLTELSVSPEFVTLVGPESELKDVTAIETTPIDFREIKESITDQLSLQMPGKLSESLQTQVVTKVKVAPIDSEKSFMDLPIEIRQSGDAAVRVQPQRVGVTVVGTQVRIAALKDGDIIPFIRIPKSKDHVGPILVQVEMPEGVRLKGVEPERVHILSRAISQPAATQQKKK